MTPRHRPARRPPRPPAPPADPAAAFAAALAVGRQALFGPWPRAGGDGLPLEYVAAVGVELRDRLRRLAAEARRLAAGRPDADALVPWVGRRLEAWAAYVAAADAVRAAHEDGDPAAPAAAAALGPALDAAEACDAALVPLSASLSAAAADERVRRWADALAPPHRDLPPWWLAADEASGG